MFGDFLYFSDGWVGGSGTRFIPAGNIPLLICEDDVPLTSLRNTLTPRVILLCFHPLICNQKLFIIPPSSISQTCISC